MARTSDPLLHRDDPEHALARFLRGLQAKASTVAEPMTLKKIADASGVSQASLSKASHGDPRTSWRTVEAWVRVCEGDQATARRLWGKVRDAQEEPSSDAEAALVARAVAHWARTSTLGVPQYLESEEELRTVLQALRRYVDVPLRVLAQATLQGGIPYSRTTLSAVLSGKRPMTFEHLAAILFGCKVPVRQQLGWARAFARFGVNRDVGSQWNPRHLRKLRVQMQPAEVQVAVVVASPARQRFAVTLEQALTERGATIKAFAADARLDIEMVNRIFAGMFVPAWMIARASEAGMVGAHTRTQMVLHTLTKRLVRSPSPEERREWNRFTATHAGHADWAA
ncbi:hypothetical protein [Streptomyces sp. NPDC050534]|uniref:hypothetical protein n=1 Tax=Streptomyces sp. NPDC050534 TaxID=3365625 RepID=UPI003795AB79